MWPPWKAAECVRTRVTGFSVFVWSMIPGVYVGFSFLARDRGRERGRERSERKGRGGGGGAGSLTSVMEGNCPWRKNYFLSSILSHTSTPHDCSKRYRTNVYKTDLAQQTAGTLHNDPCLSPSHLALPFTPAYLHSPPTTYLPLRWGGMLHSPFPFLASQFRLPRKGAS